jgi:hypothetical protein
MEWIDKNNKYPEAEFYVLVCTESGVGIGQYYPEYNYWDYSITGHVECSDNKVTHWQLLPQLP